jgi:hypothetical protein
VPWSTGNGTATAGVDYVAANGTVTFVAGNSTSQTVTVSLIGDDTYEPDETFDVTISPPAQYFANATSSTGVVTILNDDAVRLAHPQWAAPLAAMADVPARPSGRTRGPGPVAGLAGHGG